MTTFFIILGIILLIAFIIFIIRNKDKDQSFFDGFLDFLLISDAIDLIGLLLSKLRDSWSGDGGGFSGGGSSGSWDFDFDD